MKPDLVWWQGGEALAVIDANCMLMRSTSS
jgi:hypothetical protein